MYKVVPRQKLSYLPSGVPTPVTIIHIPSLLFIDALTYCTQQLKYTKLLPSSIYYSNSYKPNLVAVFIFFTSI